MEDCTFIDHAVGGKGLGGGGGVNRQGDLGGIRPLSGDGSKLHLGGSCGDGFAGEADFHAVVGGDGHLVAGLIGEGQVAYLGDHIHGDVFISLVLEDNRHLELVAEVEEAGGGGAHHQGEPGGEAGFAGAELLAAIIHSDHHDAVAGEVIRQGNPYAEPCR